MHAITCNHTWKESKLTLKHRPNKVQKTFKQTPIWKAQWPLYLFMFWMNSVTSTTSVSPGGCGSKSTRRFRTPPRRRSLLGPSMAGPTSSGLWAPWRTRPTWQTKNNRAQPSSKRFMTWKMPKSGPPGWLHCATTRCSECIKGNPCDIHRIRSGPANQWAWPFSSSWTEGCTRPAKLRTVLRTRIQLVLLWDIWKTRNSTNRTTPRTWRWWLWWHWWHSTASRNSTRAREPPWVRAGSHRTVLRVPRFRSAARWISTSSSCSATATSCTATLRETARLQVWLWDPCRLWDLIDLIGLIDLMQIPIHFPTRVLGTNKLPPTAHVPQHPRRRSKGPGNWRSLARHKGILPGPDSLPSLILRKIWRVQETLTKSHLIWYFYMLKDGTALLCHLTVRIFELLYVLKDWANTFQSAWYDLVRPHQRWVGFEMAELSQRWWAVERNNISNPSTWKTMDGSTWFQGAHSMFL